MCENVCLPSYLIVLLLPSCILPQWPLSLTSVHLVLLPKLNGACHPVGRDHHSGALYSSGIAAAILGSGRPGISPSGARSASGQLQCGSTPGSQAGWHALLFLLLLLFSLQHYHKGCSSPRPLPGVYIEHWCYDIVVIKQHAIFADLVPFSLTLGCSKYELRYWNQCNM